MDFLGYVLFQVLARSNQVVQHYRVNLVILLNRCDRVIPPPLKLLSETEHLLGTAHHPPSHGQVNLLSIPERMISDGEPQGES